MALTEGFKLSPVDVDRLPGIAEICQGKLPTTLTRALEQAITDATDPRALHDVPRKVSWTLTLLPDADALSAVWRLPKPVKVELAAGHQPPSGRVLFEKQKGVLSARALHVEEHPEAKSPPDQFTAVLLDVPVDELIAGELDLAFKRASILLLLDCDDGRKVVAVERKISFSICVSRLAGGCGINFTAGRWSCGFTRPSAASFAGGRCSMGRG